MLNDLITFCPSLHRSVEDALERTEGRARPGHCSYGQTISCCSGWRNVDGICQRKLLCSLVAAQLYDDILPRVHGLAALHLSKTTQQDIVK